MRKSIKEAACILLIFALFYALLLIGEATQTQQPKKNDNTLILTP